MKGTVLITDSLFIFPEHEKKLQDAGYEIKRLDKPEATEQEVVEAVKGKVGYIMGGLEKFTQTVLEAAEDLKVISFCGIDYTSWMPAREQMTKRGIAITNVPDGPVHAVAEWAMTMALAMNRKIFELGRVGDKSFMTTPGIENAKIGFIGVGQINRHIAELIQPFRPASLSYWNYRRQEKYEEKLIYKDIGELFSTCDIIFIGLPDAAGKSFINKGHFDAIKKDALVVSYCHDGIIDKDSLFESLTDNKFRMASDYPMDDRFNDLSLSNWYCNNGTNAFNTVAETQYVSDRAVESLLNILETGKDKRKVN